jgi:predicted ATPase
MDNIRNFLANAYSFHRALEDGRIQMKEGMFDFYAKLEDLYKKVFPNRAFEGARPRFDIFEKAKAPDFFLSCDGKQYELGEMSAGERAIFPILMDFARWNINNSIIIIDEIELHLHPPLQQGFVRVLEKLGNNNQFILTTHSNNVGIFFKETENQIIFL